MEDLYVSGIIDDSVQNGKGIRTVIFVSGCNHYCKGCHNEELWDMNSGRKMSVDKVYDKVKENMPLVKGITLSGGDPMEQAAGLSKLCKLAKGDKLNIWCYTGYRFEDLLKLEDKMLLLSEVDVLVDGKFDIDKMETGLKYRGSSNQRIIDVKKSLDKGEVVLYDLG